MAAMPKFFPNTTMLAILFLSIAMLATHGVTTSPISAPGPTPDLENCIEMATAGKCKQEFVNGVLKKGRVVKRCCGVMRDVGKDCFIGILKSHQDSSHDNKVNWDAFWNNSTRILQQCELSS